MILHKDCVSGVIFGFGSLYKLIPKVWGQTLGERREKIKRKREKMEEIEPKM